MLLLQINYHRMAALLNPHFKVNTQIMSHAERQAATEALKKYLYETTVCSLITKDLEKSTSSEAEPPRKKAKVSVYYVCNFVLQLQKLKLMFVLQLTWNCMLRYISGTSES